MLRREELIRMRAAFRVITRDLVQEVIVIANRENNGGSLDTAAQQAGRAAAMGTFAGRIQSMTVESFIDSLPKKEQAELAALMVLGREPHILRARDVEAAADPTSWTCSLGQYLASKGGLARYLQEGMRVLGL